MAHRYPPDDPREWLNRAACNFLLAKQKTPRVYLEDLCVEMYACAEKSAKAVYVLNGMGAPATRSLDDLLNGLAAKGIDVAIPRAHLAVVAPYGPGAEYPGTAMPVSEDEYENALNSAHEILDWARSAVSAVPAYA